MSILLRETDVVAADYQSVSSFHMRFYKVSVNYKKQYKTSEAAEPDMHHLKQSISAPVILLVTGYGVVCKEQGEDSPVISRILSDTNTFFYKEKDGVVSFIRREQLEQVSVLFEKNNIEVGDIDFITGEITPEKIVSHVQCFVNKNITLKRIFTPGRSGSVIAMCIYKNIRLYLFALLFILLSVNLFIKGKLEKRYSIQTAELSSLRKQNELLQEVSQEKDKIMQVFRDNISRGYGMLCDYLAAGVPADIILQRMGVQPLRKALSNGESPDILADTIIISGYTSRTESITCFIQNIEKEEYINKVQLKQMKQDKETGRFIFTIEILI